MQDFSLQFLLSLFKFEQLPVIELKTYGSPNSTTLSMVLFSRAQIKLAEKYKPHFRKHVGEHNENQSDGSHNNHLCMFIRYTKLITN